MIACSVTILHRKSLVTSILLVEPSGAFLDHVSSQPAETRFRHRRTARRGRDSARPLWAEGPSGGRPSDRPEVPVLTCAKTLAQLPLARHDRTEEDDPMSAQVIVGKAIYTIPGADHLQVDGDLVQIQRSSPSGFETLAVAGEDLLVTIEPALCA